MKPGSLNYSLWKLLSERARNLCTESMRASLDSWHHCELVDVDSADGGVVGDLARKHAVIVGGKTVETILLPIVYDDVLRAKQERAVLEFHELGLREALEDMAHVEHGRARIATPNIQGKADVMRTRAGVLVETADTTIFLQANGDVFIGNRDGVIDVSRDRMYFENPRDGARSTLQENVLARGVEIDNKGALVAAIISAEKKN